MIDVTVNAMKKRPVSANPTKAYTPNTPSHCPNNDKMFGSQETTPALTQLISERREVENLDPRLLSILTGSRSSRMEDARDATTYPIITPTNSHPANTNVSLPQA